MNREREVKRKKKWIFILPAIMIVILLLMLIVLLVFRVKTVNIEGNEIYSKDEIKELLMSGEYSYNSLYLYYKYHYAEKEQIPFIDKIDLRINSPGEVTFNVYEKGVVGCFEYMGSFMYFDKDGIVVESSAHKNESVPLISGLSFEYLVINEKLPVQNEELFLNILNLTQLLQKYSLVPDKIYYDSKYNVTLYFESVRVMIGGSSSLNDKISNLSYIIGNLKGLSGVLHMENFNEDSTNITFEKE